MEEMEEGGELRQWHTRSRAMQEMEEMEEQGEDEQGGHEQGEVTRRLCDSKRNYNYNQNRNHGRYYHGCYCDYKIHCCESLQLQQQS